MSRNLVVATRTQRGWVLAPVFGYYAGKTIASAEQLTMVNVEFKGTSIVGEVTASHGLVITEDKADLATVKSLGLGGTFRRGPNCVAARIVGDEYVGSTGRVMYRASYAALTMGGVFYAP